MESLGQKIAMSFVNDSPKECEKEIILSLYAVLQQWQKAT